MVYRISILVKDPDPVFRWTEQNVPASSLIRQIAKGVNYEAVKDGAIISVCPENDPDFGWVVQTFVKDLEAANAIMAESIWAVRPSADRAHAG